MKKLIFIFFALCSVTLTAQGPSKTEIVKTDDGWQVMRNGEPYFIKGAGGHVHMDIVVESGGNSIRTWGLDNAKQILDEAHEKGLTVMMGLWMAHERHGFDYSDDWAVTDQIKGFRQAVRELKDHPALLLWGVGNEVDLFYSNINVWNATERLAAAIKEEDPNHPTCAVTAGIDATEVQLIKKHAPSIDILGVNTYGAINFLKHNVDLFGWDGPYIVSEWGPSGHWEVPTTSWGAPIEQTSHEKAMSYDSRYTEGILGDKEQCIGSYVFLWGQKQETTPTWYGMFLEDGSKTEAIDILQKHWSGKLPANCGPQLVDLKMNGKGRYDSVKLIPGEQISLEVDMTEPENEKVSMRLEIIPESNDIKSGGDKEDRPESVYTATITDPSKPIEFNSPGAPGAYRAFVYVYDPQGKAGTGNFPFYVE